MGHGLLQTRHSPHPAAEADGGREHALQGVWQTLRAFLSFLKKGAFVD